MATRKAQRAQEQEEVITVSTKRRGSGVPDGIHRFQVVETETRTGNAGPYWNFTCEVAGGPFEGQRIWTVVSHSDASAFKMDEWLNAFDVPEDEEIDDTYFQDAYFRGKVGPGKDANGNPKPAILAYLPDEAPKKKGKPVVRQAVEEEDDEDTEEEDTGEEDEDADEEDTDVDEEEEDEEDTGEEEVLEEDEEEEDEEPEPAPAPKKKGKPAKVPAAKPVKAVTGKGLPKDVIGKGKPVYRQPFGKKAKK